MIVKTLQGTITVLKDKEGNIKIPRTTANAVQLVSGESIETVISNIYTKSEVDKMIASLTLNGEITLGSYASKELVEEMINAHTYSYNDLLDKPELLDVNEAVTKDYLQEELAKLPILDNDEIISQLNTKVNIEAGKDLSTNDFSDEYKAQLDDYKETLKPIAFSGSYNDLSDTPLVDVNKSYVDALVSMRAPLVHEHTQYLSTLPAHNHDDLYYSKSEVDKAIEGSAFYIEDVYQELKTDDKTIIGAINELYDKRISTTAIGEADIESLQVDSLSSPVLSGITDNFDYMQQKIDALEARVRELEDLLK